MNEVLVIFYSYTGTARRVAQRLAAERGWPVGEVVDAAPRAGGRGTWRCVLDSLLRRRPAIRYEGPDPAAFGTVVLVSPIWVGRLASPMRSFLYLHAAELGDFAVATVMGSNGAPAALAEITAIAERRPLLHAAFLRREVDDGSADARLAAFATAVQRARNRDAAPVRPSEWSTAAG
jgi:flavodoxin